VSRWTVLLARRIDVVFLAALAYLPALLSSPGRMPADTKLYLYTDPGGLIQRAASTFEPDQFAGWVPHQQITYLWPSGPWFWLFDALSLPDWIAHRLWIGSIMFAAGMGVRSCARILGHTGPAALAAAAVYQFSPYLLPYVSRTSLLLLPWAGLGWIVAATIRATRLDGPRSPLDRWREPAIIGLIVATVGSTNATALAMIIPAPALWILLRLWQRQLPLGQAVAVTARVATACTAVSASWIAMLVVQSRSGAPVLLYSETLEDVSRNATGPEVFRGMGYWLFYGRDAFSATTTASIDYLTRSSHIAISFLVAILGLIGLGFGRGEHRQYAALLTVTGMVLAVGVHPIDDSSPLMQLLVGDSETGLALALRSSTRAVPVLVLGLALGTAALVERVPTTLIVPSAPSWASARRVCAVGLVALAVINMPSLWRAELVDPAIDRDSELPAAWKEAAASLDTAATDSRVLQLPGAEFGAFDWGYTVDQPLVSATARQLVTRDLLPLGAAPAMDLLYALDDRVQAGTLEPGAVAPVARLFGVGAIWVANDLDALRFRTPPAGVVDDLLLDAPGLSGREQYGPIATPISAGIDPFGRPLVDADAIGVTSRPVAPVVVINVDDPTPIIRVKSDEVIFSGSGEGVIDAASAGLIDGSELLIASSTVAAIEESASVIVTDSNRDRARHWRSSQDVLGHTEPGGADPDVLVATQSDQRLDPNDTADDERAQTVAVQRGPLTAVASSYGEPFAYRPEDRAVMAIDGDPSTAWSVSDHGSPVGEVLRLTPDRTIEALTIKQIEPAPRGRSITSISIESEAGQQEVDLTDASLDGSGQVVRLDHPSDVPLDLIIRSVTPSSGTTSAAGAGVGFTEIDAGFGPTLEYIRPPIDALEKLSPGQESLDVVFTRDRVEATSRWRSDPEPVLRRLLPLTSPAVFEIDATLRLDQRASDAAVASLIGNEGAIADRRLPGIAHRGAAAVDGAADTAWLTPVDEAIGAQLTIDTVTQPISVLDIVQPVGMWSAITEVVLSSAEDSIAVPIPPPDAGGRSRIDLADAVGTVGEPLTITITQIAPSLAIERRYGDTITMPAGIAEISGTDGIEASTGQKDRLVTSRCTFPGLEVDGALINLAFDTSVSALLAGEAVPATSCDGLLDLSAGEHEIVAPAVDDALTVDRLVLSTPRQQSETPAVGALRVLSESSRRHVVEVDCPDGCWLVLGMGHNVAWTANDGSGDLGQPSIVDAGFNGWWIEPTPAPQRITLWWTAQRAVTVGLALSGAAIAGLILVLIVGTRRRKDRPPTRLAVTTIAARSLRSSWLPSVLLGGAVAIFVSPLWGALALIVGGADAVLRSHGWGRAVLPGAGTLLAVGVSVMVVVIERRDAPFPNPGWTATFDHLHGAMLTAVFLVTAAALRGPESDTS
jgi:arabinofuranan 3-O-arabinosyltransferase